MRASAEGDKEMHPINKAVAACGLVLALTCQPVLAAPGGHHAHRQADTASPTRKDQRMTRIPLPEREDMTPEQQHEYDTNPTARTNIARLFKVAPTMAPPLGALNMAMATSITVPPLEREIVALATLHLERGEYEIAQHLVVAEMMGIPKAKVDAIANERYGDPVFTDRERALLAFTRQVVRSVRVDDPTFAAVAAFYDPRQIMETVFVIGNYMMILRLSEVAEIPVDGTDGASFWKNQKKD